MAGIQGPRVYVGNLVRLRSLLPGMQLRDFWIFCGRIFASLPIPSFDIRAARRCSGELALAECAVSDSLFRSFAAFPSMGRDSERHL
jgi:hypothetical protein